MDAFAAFSPDGKKVVTHIDGKLAQVWDTQGQLLASLENRNDVLCHFFPDSKMILTRLYEGEKISLWNIEGELIAEIDEYAGAFKFQIISPNSNMILTISNEKKLNLWGSDGQLISDFDQPIGSFSFATFSPDSKMILTGSDDNSTKLWPTPRTVYDWLQSEDCSIPPLTPEERKKYNLLDN